MKYKWIVNSLSIACSSSQPMETGQLERALSRFCASIPRPHCYCYCCCYLHRQTGYYVGLIESCSGYKSETKDWMK